MSACVERRSRCRLWWYQHTGELRCFGQVNKRAACQVATSLAGLRSKLNFPRTPTAIIAAPDFRNALPATPTTMSPPPPTRATEAIVWLSLNPVNANTVPYSIDLSGYEWTHMRGEQFREEKLPPAMRERFDFRPKISTLRL